jgi:hypothetical protein
MLLGIAGFGGDDGTAVEVDSLLGVFILDDQNASLGALGEPL